MDTFTITEGQFKGQKVSIFKDSDEYRAEFQDEVRWGRTWKHAILSVLDNYNLKHLISKYQKPLKKVVQ